MSPYEIIGIIEYLPDGGFRSLAIWIALISGAVVAFREMLNFCLGTTAKSVEKMAKKFVDHAEFKPFKEAASELPGLKNCIVSMAEQTSNHEERFESVEKKIEMLQAENKEYFLLMLGNSLKRIYYELIQMKDFNQTMYKDFIGLYEVYESKGGNGMVSGYKEILESRWKSHMQNDLI